MLPVFKTNSNDFLPAFASALFDDFHFAPFGEEKHLTPAVNITENDAAYRIELAAPGISKEDFKISIEKNELTVSCHKERNEEEKNDKTLRKEFSYSQFSRSFILPEKADRNGIAAAYADGVLTITVPKSAEQHTSREIAIA